MYKNLPSNSHVYMRIIFYICLKYNKQNIIIYEKLRISFPTIPTLPNKPTLIPLQYTLLLKLKMGWLVFQFSYGIMCKDGFYVRVYFSVKNIYFRIAKNKMNT